MAYRILLAHGDVLGPEKFQINYLKAFFFCTCPLFVLCYLEIALCYLEIALLPIRTEYFVV